MVDLSHSFPARVEAGFRNQVRPITILIALSAAGPASWLRVQFVEVEESNMIRMAMGFRAKDAQEMVVRSIRFVMGPVRCSVLCNFVQGMSLQTNRADILIYPTSEENIGADL